MVQKQQQPEDMELESEQIDELRQKLDNAEEDAEVKPSEAAAMFREIIGDERIDEIALKTKELAVYKLGQILCKQGKAEEVAALVKTLRPFFNTIAKAKTAKIVRTIIDMISQVPGTRDLEISLCKDCIEWCNSEKRTFLRLRVETKLCGLMLQMEQFEDALELVNKLVREVKKIDDKQLLVEIHLTESRIHHALRNTPKSKAALTASRTAANAIYVSPRVQANIDQMSGILHSQEKDYQTAYSYFFEAMEAFSNLNDPLAVKCLKYMILAKVMSGDAADVQAILKGKQGIKYSGIDTEAMRSITKASVDRSLEDFQAALKKYDAELVKDAVINTHLKRLYDTLLENNLLKIIQPFSTVEISRIAQLINLPQDMIERKLSQMILDKKLTGILDQGKGHIILYDHVPAAAMYDHGLSAIEKLGEVVESLFRRAEKFG